MKKIVIYFISFFMLSCVQKRTTEEFAPLFPFVISYDGPDNITNMSHLLDAPAGKHGFVKVEGGRFITDIGPIRFHGTNLTGPANLPSHEQADLLADRLARFGINCVRLHYFDAPYGNFREEHQLGIFGKGESVPRAFAADPAEEFPFDREAIDCQDYLIAALKKRGIYVNMNLHVARFPKGLSFFVLRMIASEKEYARKLLTRVNPYTGLAYCDDPCVAMIELNNENALFSQYHRGTIDRLPESYVEELQDQWNKWLRKKYASTESLLSAWKLEADHLSDNQSIENGSIPKFQLNDSITVEAKRDFYQFLADTEHNYWVGLSDYLKDELDVKSVVSGTQLGYSPPFVQAELDYIDSHGYWCHPSPVNEDWKIRNESMVNSMGNMIHLSTQRVIGKPYTVSEYNHPFPNQYGAEGQPMLRSYGALQGWDGVFEYTFHHRKDFQLNHNKYFFSISDRTDVLAHLPACAAIYLRGDVKEAKKSIEAPLDYATYFDRLVTDKAVGANISAAGFDTRLSMIHKTGVKLNSTDKYDFAITSDPTAKVLISDTEELTWNREKEGAGFFTINTDNCKLFTGFPEGRKIYLDDVELLIGDTRLGWATVSLMSQNANGFGKDQKSSKVLVTATGLVENKGMKIKEVDENHITLTDWGEGPVLAEGIPVTITLLSNPNKIKCYALNPEGERKIEVPVKATRGLSEIKLKPDYKTVWYEIEIN